MAHPVPPRLSAREGRRFGVTLAPAFLLLALLSAWRGHRGAAAVMAGLAAALALGAWLVPARLMPVRDAWMGLAHAISRVTTPIFLGVVYFLVLTPAGLLARLAGHRPLRRPRDAASHWVRRDASERASDLRRQF